MLSPLDKASRVPYNGYMMMIQSLLHASESYTHNNWVYRDVYVGFSRLYYILDGEAYYEENGKTVRLKKNHLYLTPVKQRFTLYDNPEDRLLHTYAHITIAPSVRQFVEIKVVAGTPLADAVALWRKYSRTPDHELLRNILQLVLSCLDEQPPQEETLAQKTRACLDTWHEPTLDMERLSRTLGYSREHITRCFSTAYHSTPKQHFMLNRMNHALQKLLSGAKVKDVAEELSFSSPYAFSKAFKKHFGLSPEQYAQTVRQDHTVSYK